MSASCSSAAIGTSAGPVGPSPGPAGGAAQHGPRCGGGALATALAFLALAFAPFPGIRDLGLTTGLGLLACLAATFLVLPALLIWLDRGTGTFAPGPAVASAPRHRWAPWAALALLGPGPGGRAPAPAGKRICGASGPG